jgi:galactoside O-acetyltransferase
VGRNVKIHDFVKIVNPEVVEIDDYSIIDDFTFILGGNGVKIGKFVHIAGFSSIIGGGRFSIEDFSGCSAGCRFITGTDDFSGKSLTGVSYLDDFKPYLLRGEIKIGKFVIFGTDTIVNPNIEISDGAATIPGSYVTKDLKPWSLYGGNPARKIKDRSQELKKFESMVYAKYYKNE